MTSEHEQHDPFARLRDADPAADRVAAPSIAPLLERLEERDAGLVRRGARRRPRVSIVLAATVLVVAAALGAIGLVGRGAGGLDVVARARAALATHGEILHVATRYTHGSARGASVRGGRGTTVFRNERWSTDEPTRFHTTRELLSGPDGPGPVEQEDYADRTFRAASSDTRELRVSVVPRRLADLMAAQRLALGDVTSFGMLGTDPVGALRRMLDEGQVHAGGEREVDGRRVLRLIYRPRPADSGRGRSYRESTAGTLVASFPIEYLVDAATFAPVRITYAGGSAGARGGGRSRQSAVPTTIVFEAYERLPLTAENERLLRIDSSGLDVVRDRRSPPVVRRVRPLRVRPAGGRAAQP